MTTLCIFQNFLAAIVGGYEYSKSQNTPFLAIDIEVNYECSEFGAGGGPGLAFVFCWNFLGVSLHSRKYSFRDEGSSFGSSILEDG